MVRQGFEISGEIINTDSSRGTVDDFNVIGGYKVVEKYSSSDPTEVTLEYLKNDEKFLKEYNYPPARLKEGCLVYCIETKKTYRWDGSDFKEEIIQASGGDGGDGGSDYSGGFKVVVNVTEFDEIRANARNSTIDLPDGFTVYVTETNLTYRWNLERRDNNAEKDFTCVTPNIERGSGDGAFQQQGGKAVATGKGSVALNGGYKVEEDGTETEGVRAYGEYSIAGGRDTAAYQKCAVALGKDCEAGLTAEEFASTFSSVDDWGDTYEESFSIAYAEGLGTKAKGRNSHAQNRGTQALANDSSASGVESIAAGRNGSNANGFKTIATGEAAFSANNQTVASGNYSAAFGSGGEALGTNAFKIGDSNKSQGACTFTMGLNNVATSYCCFVGGKNSETGAAQYTFQYGEGLRTVANNQTVFGKYNVKDSTKYDTLPVFTVGYGTSDNNRKDVFNVLRDGRAQVYGEPKDTVDVVRLVDLQTLTHAATADKAESVNDIVFLENSDGSRKTYKAFWNSSIRFAPDQYMDKSAYRYFAPTDISENPDVNYSELKLGYKYLFSHPTYGKEILVAAYHPDSITPTIFLRGRSDGAYAKFYDKVFRGLWDMPMVEEVSIYHANNADLANEAHALNLRQENVFTKTATDGNDIISRDVDDGMYLCYLTENEHRHYLGTFIVDGSEGGAMVPIRSLNTDGSYFLRYYRVGVDAKSIEITFFNEEYREVFGWTNSDMKLTCVKIGTMG